MGVLLDQANGIQRIRSDIGRFRRSLRGAARPSVASVVARGSGVASSSQTSRRSKTETHWCFCGHAIATASRAARNRSVRPRVVEPDLEHPRDELLCQGVHGVRASASVVFMLGAVESDRGAGAAAAEGRLEVLLRRRAAVSDRVGSERRLERRSAGLRVVGAIC